MAKKKGRARRFHLPESASEEQVLAKLVHLLQSTKTNGLSKYFGNGSRKAKTKVPISDPGGLFKDYELHSLTLLVVKERKWVPYLLTTSSRSLEW